MSYSYFSIIRTIISTGLYSSRKGPMCSTCRCSRRPDHIDKLCGFSSSSSCSRHELGGASFGLVGSEHADRKHEICPVPLFGQYCKEGTEEVWLHTTRPCLAAGRFNVRKDVGPDGSKRGETAHFEYVRKGKLCDPIPVLVSFLDFSPKLEGLPFQTMLLTNLTLSSI